MTPIQELYTYLQNAGLFDPWTGPDNVEQPKPFIQMRMLEEEDVPSSERLLLIKPVGNSGDRYVSKPTFLFAVMGSVGEVAVYAETYANLLYEALLDFGVSGCVIGIDPISPVNGAYKSESNRPIYDMEFIVTVDSGVLA